jgi:ketopantoate reductase
MAKALIIGAGAIGRGYLPWELKDFEVDFFDANQDLIKSLSKNGYSTYMSVGDKLEVLHVNNSNFFYDANSIHFDEYDLAFICVGPRNITKLNKKFGNLKCHIFSLENDYGSVTVLQNHLKKNNISFGIPDVITSFTASPENLKKDPNALHTENGVLYLEKDDGICAELINLLPDIKWADRERMLKEWDAKLYIHNTPHCIAAYYGYLNNCTYVHEALYIDSIKDELDGVIDEVLQTLKIKTDHDHEFLEWYAEKEISRFSNKLLFDPVKRVAREPLRKLAPGGRLVGIMTLALEAGIFPEHLSRGIAAALKYELESDADYTVISNINEMGVDAFLEYMIELNKDTIQAHLIKKAYEKF